MVNEPPAPVARLTCPSCGGSLAVPAPGIEYLACGFCGTSLHLRRSAQGVTLEFAQQLGAAMGQAVGRQLGTQISVVGQDLTLHLRYQELDQNRTRAERDLQQVGGRMQYLAAEVARLDAHPERRRFKPAIKQAQAEWAQRRQEQQYIQGQLTRLNAEYDLLKTTERIRYLEAVLSDVSRWPASARRDHDLLRANQELSQCRQKYAAICQWLYGR
jgi:hypothetical protein